MKRLLVASMLAVILIFSGTVMAQDTQTKIGIGAHLGWPTLIGPSVKVWLTPKFGIQGMGSFFSSGNYSLTMVAGRVMYKLSEADKKIAPYLGGGAGAWIAKRDETSWLGEESETTAIFMAMLGFEHRYSTNFYGDYELGYFIFDFKDVDVGSLSGMSFIFAVHYFF